MSRTSQFGSPFGAGGTGGRRRLPLVAIAAAALTGTIVGGASAYTIVMAVVQPPKHEARADAGSGANVTSQAAPAPQSVQASNGPQPAQSQPVAQAAPAVQSPSATDAERTDHSAAAIGKTPPRQEASASANDDSTAQNQSPPAGEQEQPTPSRETSITERAPWPTPRSSVKRRAVAAPESTEPTTPAQTSPPAEPAAPKPVAVDNPSPSNSAATGRIRSQQGRQQPRSPDDVAQSGADRGPAADPRQRVIILPPPQRDARSDHWDRGGGAFRLFDFSGGDHWNDDRSRSDNHWGNERW
jgi:hypothetical protein